MSEKRAIYRETAKRYQKAKKKEKVEILNEFINLTKLNRNYAATLLRNHDKKIRIGGKYILKGDITKKAPRTGRKKIYDKSVLTPLIKTWKIMDFICGKRLQPILTETVENMIENGHLKIKKEIKEKLLKISASSIDRILKKERKKLEIKGRSGTKAGALLKSEINIRTWSDWNEKEAGYFEMDLVGHEGGNSRGDFAQTLDMVDVWSGWTETFAVKNKASVWVREGIDEIRKRIPFPMKGVDSDNGSEFINYALVNYCKDQNIKFTRGRSSRSNDNCYVEQKNYSVVRKAVGYNR